MNYRGIIIEESLDDKSILKEVKIISTKIEPVTARHKTPWVDKWTMHTVEVPESESDLLAAKLSEGLDKKHEWYADYKNDKYHYIVYRGKIFKVDLKNPGLYKDARQYGISVGIPEYQVDFAPEDKIWER